jgi:hypothetical protein
MNHSHSRTSLASRRAFLKRAGISAAAANLMLGLPSFARGSDAAPRKQRLVFVFSPNGVIPDHFWPTQLGTDFDLKRILQPLADFKHQTLTLHGMCNRIKGDGDGHMRGIGCLLTGIELFPGDVQGGSGPNQPVAPIDNPYRMFDKLYGQTKNRELLSSVLDDLSADFRKVEKLISNEDRHMLQSHVALVRELEKELQMELANKQDDDGVGHAVPELTPNVERQNDNIPLITRMQLDTMVNSFAADFTRIASFQITNSVGQPKMRWLGIDEGHHELSHEPDSNEDSYEKLIKINTWYCEQVAYLAKRLAETPEPGGSGSMLDNTTIVWTNELGKGNSHTRDNIPFVLVGGGLGYKMGQALDYKAVPHNRLLMSFCEAMGHPVESFGNPDFCIDGALTGLTG